MGNQCIVRGNRRLNFYMYIVITQEFSAKK